MGAPLGNKNAAKGKMWQQAIERVIAKRPKDLEDAALALVAAAKAGDIAALKELGDRIDGKAVATVQGPADDGAHIVRAEHHIVDPADTGS